MVLSFKEKLAKKINKIQSLLGKPGTFSPSQKTQIQQIFRQIQKDVLRTPPASLFRSGYLKQSLTNVLRAYAIQDKDLRYTQGMNFIVGIVLCVLTYYGDSSDYLDESRRNKGFLEDIENKALAILEYLMYEKGLRKIMFIQRQTITDLCIRLESYIQKVSPYMADKISMSGFNVEMIFSGALISGLTTSQITLDLQKRVLDMLVTFDFSILYKIIGQFAGAAENLCQKLQNQNLYYFLKGKFYNQVYKQIGDEGLNRMFKSL